MPRNPPMNLENATKTLLDVKKILDKAGIKFWLTCGTLLGVMRSGNFIPGDGDIDLLVLAEDWKQEVFSKFQAAGFSLDVRQADLYPFLGFHKFILIKRKIPCTIFFYLYYAPKDVFVYPIAPKCYDGRWRELPRNLLEIETSVEFLRTKFRVPCEPEKLLVTMYGTTWREPQWKGWKESRKFKPMPREKFFEWLLEHPQEAMRQKPWKSEEVSR